MQRGIVYRNGICTGEISRDEKGVYRFRYDAEYLDRKDAAAISVNFPLRSDAFVTDTLFPFFSICWQRGIPKRYSAGS
jgi:HipA-like protein